MYIQVNEDTLCHAVLTFHSNPPIAIPEAAPVPAIPTKCPLPMLLANKDAPICRKEMNA